MRCDHPRADDASDDPASRADFDECGLAAPVADLCADLPDDLAEFAEQLTADAEYISSRYPEQSPALWWDRTRDAEAATTVGLQPAGVAEGDMSVGRRHRSLLSVASVGVALFSVAAVLLLLAGGWLVRGFQNQENGVQPAHRNADTRVPFAPALAGGGALALPGKAAAEPRPASWTPQDYPDVSGEEEQVLHDELKQIRAADL